MSDWQPVRIAPTTNKALCGSCGFGLDDWSGIWEEIEGQIVRARRVPVETCYMDENDKETFEIHPEDIERLNLTGMGGVFCEHQILAD